MQLSIVIVNYNVKYFLEQCLFSVIKACENIEAEIFVIDNNSTDGSREYLEKKFRNVIFKWNNSNAGFAKATNMVLPQVKGEHILFLNPDTIVPEDCFEKCLAFFKMNERCGALGVRMIDGSGEFLKESKRSFPSPLTSLFKITGLAAVFPKSKTIAKYYAGHLPQNKTNEVEVLAGAFMMLTKKTLEKTGGFDEKFFMYGEDIDLSYRIKNEGIKIYYFADVTIIHFKGESTYKLSATHIHNFYGAMRLFVKKHYSRKKGLNFSMQAAIAFSVFLSTVTLFFKKIFAGFKQRIVFSSGKNNTLVVGTHQSFNKLIQILKFAKPPKTLLGRISTDPQDVESKIGVIKNIDGVIRHKHIDEIIFCEEGLGFKKIISITEGIKEESFFLYHATGSSSIVGSNCKKQQGDYIAPPPQLNTVVESKAAMPL